MSTQIEPLLTLSDLEAMPEDDNRYELIEGELFVSRAPSLIHQIIIKNLIALIQKFLDQNPLGIIVPGPGVIFSDSSGVIPDIVFIRTERRNEIASGERIIGAPDLVIEIVSPGPENEKRDRVAKRQLYGKYGVKEYWVVDPEDKSIEIYLLDGKSLKLHAVLKENEEITSSVLPGFSCKVEDLFKV
jgi:Uma2 family endonuclease